MLALFFAPLAQSGRAFVFRDLVVYEAGQDRVLREAVLERHELPARNPYAYLGVPHLADPSTQSLYPPRVLAALLFPVPRSLDVAIVLHFVLAALGAFRLARALGAGRVASVAGAAVYALSGPVLSLQENLPLLAGATWLPWSWAFALEAARNEGWRRARDLGLAAGTIALAALGGDLQAATWGGLLVLGTTGVSLARAPKTTSRVRVALGGLASIALAVGLAAVLLVPAARLRPETDRREPLPEAVAGRWSLAPARAVELLAPFPFGVSFPDGGTVTAGVSPEPGIGEPWCESLHVGLLGLILGLVGLAARRGRATRLALLGLAALGFLLALGPRAGALGPWRILRAIVPFYDVFRYPEKHVVLVALGLSGLAALGVEALRTEAGRRRASVTLLASGVALGLGFALFEGALGRELARLVATVKGSGESAHALHGSLSRALDLQAAAAVATLLLGGAALAVARTKRRVALVLAACFVAGDVAFALRPRLFLGDATLYDARPLGAALVQGSRARLLRWPWGVSENVGRVARPDAGSPGPARRLRERAVEARVLSWTGDVAARERVEAVQGFSSFVPLAVRDALPPGPELPGAATLDRLGVRWLILDAALAEKQGLSRVASSSTGVALVDRGPQVPLAPDPSFAGEVPGLALGALISLGSLAALGWVVRRGSRSRRRACATPSPL